MRPASRPLYLVGGLQYPDIGRRLGFRVSLGVLEKMSHSPLFMMSPLVLMFPRQNFSDEARKTSHGVAHVTCLACRSLQIVKSFLFSVDKKYQLDVTFCILYFSSNSCSTCFGQPCAHHQELTTA